MATTAPETAERRIHYYRVDGPASTTMAFLSQSTSARHSATSIHCPFAENGRYLSGDGGHGDLRLDGSLSTNQLLFDLPRSGAPGLPHIEETGTLSPLGIAESQGIAESIHVVLFNETILGVPSTIAGSEFNFFTARVSRASPTT